MITPILKNHEWLIEFINNHGFALFYYKSCHFNRVVEQLLSEWHWFSCCSAGSRHVIWATETTKTFRQSKPMHGKNIPRWQWSVMQNNAPCQTTKTTHGHSDEWQNRGRGWPGFQISKILIQSCQAKPSLWRSHLATHGLKASTRQRTGAGNRRFTCNVLLLRLKLSRCVSATERFLACNGYWGLITCGKWHPC